MGGGQCPPSYAIHSKTMGGMGKRTRLPVFFRQRTGKSTCPCHPTNLGWPTYYEGGRTRGSPLRGQGGFGGAAIVAEVADAGFSEAVVIHEAHGDGFAVV